jgi:hypothetical protein
VAGNPAVAIGKSNKVSCSSGVSIGDTNTISGQNAVAIGTLNNANGKYAIAMGGKARANSDGSFTWSGSDKVHIAIYPEYFDHGKGTFNVNPAGGLSGFYIGEQSLNDILLAKADLSAIPTKTSQLSNDSGFITSADIITKRDLSDMTVKGIPQNTNYQSWFTIKYGTTTENAYYYDEGRWESGVTTSVLATSANIYTLRKNQGGQLTNIGEFQLDNNSEATVTYDGVTYSITGYVGEIVTSNQLISQIAALEARIAALEGN